MTYFIKIGGIMVILAVFGIFFFILSQIIPLFKGAKVAEETSLPFPPGEYTILGVDEWSELPFAVTFDGKVRFLDIVGDRGVLEESVNLPEGRLITSGDWNQETKSLLIGTNDGHFATIRIEYVADFVNEKRLVRAKVVTGEFYPIGDGQSEIQMIAGGESGSTQLIAAIQKGTGEGIGELHAVELTRKRSLMGQGKFSVSNTYNFTDQLTAVPEKILIPNQADSLVTVLENGEVEYFFRTGGQFELRQKFFPFEDLENRKVSSMNYILGDVSLVFTNTDGVNRIFSLYVHPGGAQRLFGQIKAFPDLPGGAEFYSKSLRNKAFLLGKGNYASLRYSTTESVRWEQELPFTVEHAVISGKYDKILFLDSAHQLHLYQLDDPHPETNFRGLFGKLWYEGASEPKYEWQSTGGTDDFEPKLSLIPLIIGTLKGTLYAMLIAIPIALTAALYTSQFLHPSHRAIVKPTMEIMASLPSVVLGFLAALWLAPLIVDRVPSIIVLGILLPASACLVGSFWNKLPVHIRVKIKPGYEFLAVIPVLLVVSYIGWNLGPVLENLLFTVKDPVTGERVGDFARWWPEFTGAPYEQRNSLVVGFMMGFAVIPIIFTITEDALSNVPAALRSGSLALGASRWQTALHVVLPTASAGIFSALMIGLGRAVGETMIMVMATGNTPIMDFNIFSGMRTLSANIAVELPEAPHHGTLYRTLFLGAMVLFMFTFLINTLAEILRQYLREKYKTV